MTELSRNTILHGDALTRLGELPSASVDCVVTSPPYYMLRTYGVEGQLGLEASVDEWVTNLVAVMREVRRVLKPSGAVWLNVSDSYSRHPRFGAPAKSLLLAPERLAVALSADSWILRNAVRWCKPNAMPSSVRDRLNTAHETIWLLVKSRRYWFDLDAIRLPHQSSAGRKAQLPVGKPAWAGPLAGKQDGLRRERPVGQPGHWAGKNPGDWWNIPTRPFRHAHFATFPPDLVRRPILATCPEAICSACGEPWRRRITVKRIGGCGPTTRDQFVRHYNLRWTTVRQVGDFERCACQAPTQPGVVLDPFMGAGTTAVVARELGRDFVGIELNADYIKLAERRLGEMRAAA